VLVSTITSKTPTPPTLSIQYARCLHALSGSHVSHHTSPSHQTTSESTWIIHCCTSRSTLLASHLPAPIFPPAIHQQSRGPSTTPIPLSTVTPTPTLLFLRWWIRCISRKPRWWETMRIHVPPAFVFTLSSRSSNPHPLNLNANLPSPPPLHYLRLSPPLPPQTGALAGCWWEYRTQDDPPDADHRRPVELLISLSDARPQWYGRWWCVSGGDGRSTRMTLGEA